MNIVAAGLVSLYYQRGEILATCLCFQDTIPGEKEFHFPCVHMFQMCTVSFVCSFIQHYVRDKGLNKFWPETLSLWSRAEIVLVFSMLTTAVPQWG